MRGEDPVRRLEIPRQDRGCRPTKPHHVRSTVTYQKLWSGDFPATVLLRDRKRGRLQAGKVGSVPKRRGSPLQGQCFGYQIRVQVSWIGNDKDEGRSLFVWSHQSRLAGKVPAAAVSAAAG